MRVANTLKYLLGLSIYCVSYSTLKAADFVSVNDWGSGFNATFEHTIESDDAPSGSVRKWMFNVEYSGGAQLVNAWMSGYNGSVASGDENGTFTISNQGSAPDLAVGSTLVFTVQGQGAGFNEADFSIAFESLDPVGNGAFTSSFISVNDWYNPSWGGGFNATFECVVSSSTPIEEFIAEFNYTGAGTPVNSWAQSYNGSTVKGFIGQNGGYAIRSPEGNSYRPTLQPGDSFRIVVQVDGAGFSQSDFDFNCRDAANRAPMANAGADLTATVGSAVALSGAASTDEDGDSLSYQWTIISTPDGSQAQLSDPNADNPTLTPDLVGDYVIELIVSDGSLSSDPDEVTITAVNSVLTAIPRAIPASGDAPLVVTFSPDAITDTAIERYQWDFNGDGTIDRSETVGSNYSYTFSESGVYQASLRVTDSNGDSATATVTINVGNEPPVVTAEAAPSNGGVPLTVTFQSNATDANGIQDYTWDFDGDGVGDQTTTSATIQYTYETQGVFQPIVTVQDTLGASTTLQVPSVEVRAGPPGSPTVTASASVSSGVVPLDVNLSASASNLGGATVTQFDWDVDGDGTYELIDGQSSFSQTYNSPGRFYTRVRITTDSGATAEDVVEVIVTPSVSLSVTQDTIDTELGDFTSVNTVLGGTTSVSVVIENVDGQVVRTLIPTTTRSAGNYSDDWDGTDDAGELVAEGQYRAILLYDYDGNTERLDLGLTTGGRQYNPSRSRIPSSFQPYANNPLVIDYTLPKPAEVTAFMGRFNANTRLITFFQRDAMGRGTHRITWHGENSEGQLIHPPAGDRFLFGIWAYDLPDNAIYVQNRIDVNQLVAAPPIFTPTGRETLSNISFSLDKPGSVEIVINDTVSGLTHRTAVVSGLSAGANVWQWDGLDDDGNYVAAGSYRVGVTGSDDAGGRSITQYTLQRVFY